MASAILLAAGESTRMGRPKALLPWADTTLLGYQVRELRAAGVDDVIVVLGHDAEALRPHVPSEARVVVNQSYREGRASSLRAGAAALPDDAGPIVVLGVDQPRPRDVHEALLAAHSEGGPSITVPTVDRRRGHPVLLAGELLPELRAVTDVTKGLRGLLLAHAAQVREVPFGNQIVRLDVNTPAEYERALASFGGASL